MIKLSATKGEIGFIEIPIYHNNKAIDFDSIQELIDVNINHLRISEKFYLKELKK